VRGERSNSWRRKDLLFRDRLIAASMKQLYRKAVWGLSAHFRDQLIAASLEPGALSPMAAKAERSQFEEVMSWAIELVRSGSEGAAASAGGQ
jgi:hypothetical protein